MQDVVWQIVTGVSGVVIPVAGWQFWLIINHKKEARAELDKVWENMQNKDTSIDNKITHQEAGELMDLKLAPIERSLDHVVQALRDNTEAVNRLRESMVHGQNQG